MSSVEARSIFTQGIENETAITNIKEVLQQGKAIWFAYLFPDDSAWSSFYSFWSFQTESQVWRPDFAAGATYDYYTGGGHAVLCVGYDDTDPNNRYWIMLNSWGASPGRPNGLFRMNMDMDYSCSYKGLGYAFYWMTLDIDYGQANRPPDMPARPSGSTGAALGSLYSYSTIEKRSRWRPGEVYLWLGRRIHFSHGPGRIRHKCGGVTFLEQSWKISGQGHGHGQQWRRFRLVERPDNNRKCKQASGRTKKAHRVCQGLYRISLWIHHQCKRSRGRPDEYTFDWGDESTFDWGDGAISVTSYKSSGNTARVSHRWRKAGTYQVKAMTTDRKSASSGWSKPLTVTVA